MGQDSSTIRKDIEETRERMGDTVDALAYKTDVGARTRDAVTGRVDAVKEKLGVAGDKLGDATGKVSGATDALPSGSDVTQQAFEFGAREALTLIALISLSLAIINLFPFLPLDGGHIFWSLVEKLRGRPVPFSIMERAGVVGFLLVMILFAVGLSNDIDKLTGQGFNVR